MRDTGIKQATNGLADVRVLRFIKDANFSVKHSDEFLFFFVLKGNLKLKAEDKIYDLTAGDGFVLPNDTEYLIDAAKNLEIIRVCLPAE